MSAILDYLLNGHWIHNVGQHQTGHRAEHGSEYFIFQFVFPEYLMDASVSSFIACKIFSAGRQRATGMGPQSR